MEQLGERGKDYQLIQKERVLEFVAKLFGVSEDLIMSKTRFRKISMPRQAIMYNLFQRGHTHKSIGQFLGDRHHSTSIHGVRVWGDLSSTYPEYKSIQEKIDKELSLDVVHVDIVQAIINTKDQIKFAKKNGLEFMIPPCQSNLKMLGYVE